MMDSFIFNLPTKLYFGKKQEDNLGKILKERKARKVLLIYGQGSAYKSGLVTKLIASLEKEHISVIEFGGIRPNPTIGPVHEGIRICREQNVDFIVAIGGGSAMDTAKLISTGFYYDGDPFDISLQLFVPIKALPLGVVVTIAASGSEMSSSCVIQDDETGIKRGYNSEFNRPLFAIENPELTFSVPKNQTAYGIVDILMHTLERYFSFSSSDHEPSDAFSEALVKSTIESGLIAYHHPKDYDARANLLLLSSFSHNGLTSIGKKYSMPVHQLEHILSGLYPFVAHGAGLAALFPSWARYYVNYDVEKFDSFARNVFGLFGSDKLENAKKGIEKLEQYFQELEMPTTFKDLGIDHPDIPRMVEMLTDGGTRVINHHVKHLDREVATEIYRALL